MVFILWILAVILMVSGIVAILRKDFLWGVVQAAESTVQHVGYQEAPVEQTVLIKPGWYCAAGVQGFTTTRLVGLDAQTVYLTGELDLYSNADATAAFAVAVGAGLPTVVDLTDLDVMDCSGYRAIATARHAAEQHGIALTITNAHGEPAHLLNLLGEHRRGTAAALLHGGSC